MTSSERKRYLATAKSSIRTALEALAPLTVEGSLDPYTQNGLDYAYRALLEARSRLQDMR